MNKHVKRKWVKALKSSEYGKGKMHLGSPRFDEYCCLGVLVCEMVPEFVTTNLVGAIEVGNEFNKTGYLPDDLATLWDLSILQQARLAGINDDNDTFEPVIKFIEEHL